MRVEARREEEPEQDAPFGRRRTGEGEMELVKVRLAREDLEKCEERMCELEKRREMGRERGCTQWTCLLCRSG